MWGLVAHQSLSDPAPRQKNSRKGSLAAENGKQKDPPNREDISGDPQKHRRVHLGNTNRLPLWFQSNPPTRFLVFYKFSTPWVSGLNVKCGPILEPSRQNLSNSNMSRCLIFHPDPDSSSTTPAAHGEERYSEGHGKIGSCPGDTPGLMTEHGPRRN